MRVSAIPAFRDNYIWALHSGDNSVFVVDPGAAEPVEQFLRANGLALAGILITHHHADHTGGIADLCTNRNIPVYGPAGTHIKGISHPVADTDSVHIGVAKLSVMAVPGHTLDHLAYVLDAADGTPAVFCGDTLFAGGCGRLFEGSAEMMYTSLRRLAALPAQTRVYCAHEYTVGNLSFALKVEPDNTALAQRYQTELEKRQQHLPTLPSTILQEQRTNPFLRCHIASIRANVGQNMAQSLLSDVETFACLRRWKDSV